jgi:hypothetical protein
MLTPSAGARAAANPDRRRLLSEGPSRSSTDVRLLIRVIPHEVNWLQHFSSVSCCPGTKTSDKCN